MKLTGTTRLPGPPAQAWAMLHDPERLQQALPGCDALEAVGDGHYNARLQVAIGPVKAAFSGQLQLTDAEPPRRYRLGFQGQGGAAGHGKGHALVTLTPDGNGTVLHYEAEVQVGGKLAQLGSRLIEPASAALASAFFARLTEAWPEAPTAAVGDPAVDRRPDIPAPPPPPRWWARWWAWLWPRPR